jgi:hypothetical protein
MREIKGGSVDRYAFLTVLDADGVPVEGIAHTDVTAAYAYVEGAVSATSISLAAGSLGTHVDGHWYEVGGGRYTLALADAFHASGNNGKHVRVWVELATGGSVEDRYDVVTNLQSDTHDRVGAPAGASIAADIAANQTILASGTHGNAALKTLIDAVDTVVDSILDDTGTSGVVLANDAITAAKVAADAVTEIQSGLATASALTTVNTTVNNIETDTQDIQSKIGTPSDLGGGATLAANLVVVEGQTDDIGAAGAGLTAVPWNASWDAEVQSEVADALAVYDPPTKTELDAGFAALNDVSTAEVQTAAAAALTAYDPPTSAEFDARTLVAANYATATNLATVDTVADAIKVVTDRINALIEDDGLGDDRFTAKALEEAPSGGGGGGDATEANQLTILSRLGTPTNLGSGATLAANLADIEGQTDDIGAAGAGLTALPWNAAWDAEVQSEAADALNAYDPPTKAELDAGLAALNDVTTVEVQAAAAAALSAYDPPTNTELEARTLPAASYATSAALAIVDGIVDTIVVDTSTDIPALLATIAGYLDTEIAAIKAKTDTIPLNPATEATLAVMDALIDAIKLKTDTIPVNPATEAKQDTIITAVADLNDLDATAVQAAALAAITAYDPPTNAEFEARTVPSSTYVMLSACVAGAIDTGAVSAATGSFAGDSALSSSNDFYNDGVLSFTSGALKGLSRRVSDYTGATRVFSFVGDPGDADAPWPSAPSNNDTFIIVGRMGT